MKEENGKWVTLENGVHLFIEKGQSFEDALKNNIIKKRSTIVDKTLTRNGINTFEMSEEDKQKKFDEIGGESNWAYKAYADYENGRDLIKEQQDYRKGLSEEEIENESKTKDSQLNKLTDRADVQAEEIKARQLEETSQKYKELRRKRYDSSEYSQLEMQDHVEEDLGLDWHDVKQIYFLEDTFKQDPENAVVELENGDYIEYNVLTGERKDTKAEDWVDPWNRKTGFGKKATEYIKSKK